MFYPIYFSLPYVSPRFFLPYSYYNPFSSYLLDSYALASPFDNFYSLNSFSSPSLWRYNAFGLQDAALNSEYWAGLDRTMQDSYYRTLLTASEPPIV